MGKFEKRSTLKTGGGDYIAWGFVPGNAGKLHMFLSPEQDPAYSAHGLSNGC